MIGSTLGHFRIEEKLGAGGMGEVYRALDLRLGRQVALKFIHPDLAGDPDARPRFQREARALAALDHPYVGTVFGVEEADGRLFMVLALVRGRNVDELMAGGPLPAERARTLIARIAEGLAAAHARGIVHRDIKSSNILVGEGDTPKLVDFGIARGPHDTRLTRTGAMTGTPGFTAPEIYAGADADHRSDIFSLGVVAYHVLTGAMPFPDANPMATMHAVLNQEPAPFPPSLPAETRALEPIVRRCLEKDPGARFADASTMAGAFAQGITADAGTPARQRAAASRASKPRRRRAIGVGVVALVAVLGTVLLTRTDRAAKPAPASRPSAVGVIPFENRTGDAGLDWMGPAVGELLTSALAQSAALDVFDSRRLAELAAQDRRWSRGRGGPAATDPQQQAVAQSFDFLISAGIPRAITGSILRSGEQLRIQGRVVEVTTGKVIRAATAEGAQGDLFRLVGALIPDLQVALEVELGGNREASAWLRELTTPSTDAYRLYLQGHQSLLNARWLDASRSLSRAVALDSNFVDAWADLAGATWNLDDDPGLARARAHLRRLRDRADPRSLLRIEQMESIIDGNSAEVIRTSRALIQLYPENRFYRYLLGRGLHTNGEHRQTLAVLTPLLDQRYEWPWTYMLASRSYRKLGAQDSADAVLRLGIEVTGQNPELTMELALTLAARGDRIGSRQALESARNSPAIGQTPSWHGLVLYELARLNLEEGRRDSAQAQLARAVVLLADDDPKMPDARRLLADLQR